jgi:hypothetical protein
MTPPSTYILYYPTLSLPAQTELGRSVPAASGLITVSGPPDVALTSGMPHQERKERVVRIYKPAKNAMQSGTAGIKR